MKIKNNKIKNNKIKNNKIKISKVIIGISAIAIIAVGMLTLFRFNRISKENELKELRAAYPACDRNPPTIDMNDYKFTFDEVVKKLGIVVVGEALETFDNTMDMSGEEGTPERAISDKLSKSGIKQDAVFVNIKFKVTDIIKGQVDSDEIILIQNKLMADYGPQFKQGQKLLLILQKGKDMHEGKYWYDKMGFYYITDNNKVVSAISDEEFDKYTGMNLFDFEKVIKKVE